MMVTSPEELLPSTQCTMLIPNSNLCMTKVHSHWSNQSSRDIMEQYLLTDKQDAVRLTQC